MNLSVLNGQVRLTTAAAARSSALAQLDRVPPLAAGADAIEVAASSDLSGGGVGGAAAHRRAGRAVGSGGPRGERAQRDGELVGVGGLAIGAAPLGGDAP